MQTDPPARTSVLQAALYSPLVTPLVAVPTTALLLNIYANGVDLMIKLPFVAFAALLYGYLGMFLVCLPVTGILSHLRALDANRLCACTTIIGALAWLWVSGPADGPEAPGQFSELLVGAASSLAVSTTFCFLREIPLRLKKIPVRR